MTAEEKLSRLDGLLAEWDLSAAWFARSNTFAWLTGGDNVVDRGSEPGTAAVGYDGESLRVVTSNIEAGRLRVEEVPPDVTVEAYPWHEESLAGAVAERSPHPAAADFGVPGFEHIDASPLRQPLIEEDIERYRTLGQATAEALESVCRNLSADTTERTAAARLQGRLAESGLDTPVVLVGGNRRVGEYRHYVPSEEPLGDYALVSVTAERCGLYASCTRTVAFDPPAWLADRHEVATQVEVSALAATQQAGRTDGTAGDVFETIQDAYATLGHEGEWRQHHQGGAAGYAGREWIATPGHDAPVTTPMAYAWNPTVQGAKSEDTVLVTDDGFEVLTATGEWPTSGVSEVDGVVTLDRPDILYG